MQTKDLFHRLSGLYTDTEISIILQAMRQDPIVWQSLLENFDILLTECIPLPKFTPGHLGYYLLRIARSKGNDDGLVDTLQAQDINELIKSIRDLPSLTDATAIALSINESLNNGTDLRWIVNNLFESFQKLTLQKNLLVTIINCLFTLFPDTKKLFGHVIETFPEEIAYQIIRTALLSNPAGDDKLAEEFSGIIDRLDTHHQVGWLERLHFQGDVDLAKEIADILMHEQDLAGQTQNNKISDDVLVVEKLARLSKLNLAIGKHKEAIDYSNQLDEALTQLQTEIKESILSKQKLQSNNNLQVPQKPGFIGMVQRVNNLYDSIKSNDPRDEIIKELIEVAQEFKLLGDLLDESHNDVVMSSWNPVELLSLLTQFGLHKEVIECGEKALEYRPTDHEIFRTISSSLESQGDLRQSYWYRRMAYHLSHQKSDGLADLARLAVKNEAWGEAIEFWTAIIKSDLTLNQNDRFDYAKTLYYMANYVESIEQCELILQEEISNVDATSLQAMALGAIGEYDASVRLLSKLTLIQPESEDTWLQLANTYDQMGLIDREFDTLETALAAIPNSMKIVQKLTEKNLVNGNLNQAIALFEELINSTEDISSLGGEIGIALFNANRDHEAIEFLLKCDQKKPGDPNIAFYLGRSWLKMGNEEEAISHLKKAYQAKTSQEDKDLVITYLKALSGNEPLNVKMNSKKSIRIESIKELLGTNQEILDNNQEIKLLKAEVLAADSEFLASKKIYQELIQNKDTLPRETSWRLHAGYGSLLIDMGEFTEADPILKISLELNPEFIASWKLLTRALLSSGKKSFADDAATMVVKVSPDDPNNLEWYSDYLLEIGNTSKAIETLNYVSEISSTPIPAMLKIVKAHTINGNPTKAIGVLKKILGNNDISNNELISTGFLLLQNKDIDSARECFQRIYENFDKREQEHSIMTCLITILAGHVQQGIEIAENLTKQSPSNFQIIVLLADLYKFSRNNQGAIRSLEKAFELCALHENEQDKEMVNLKELLGKGEILAWLESFSSESAIRSRLFSIDPQNNILVNDLSGSSISGIKDRYLGYYRFQIAEYFSSLGLYENANVLVDQFINRQEASAVDDSIMASMFALKCELAIGTGDLELAKNTYNTINRELIEPVRIECLEGRIAYRSGDWVGARKIISQAIENYFRARSNSDDKGIEKLVFWPSILGIENELGWLVNAALEVGLWHELNSNLFSDHQFLATSLLLPLHELRMLVSQLIKEQLFEEIRCKSMLQQSKISNKDLEIRFKVSLQQIKSSLPVDVFTTLCMAIDVLVNPTENLLDTFSKHIRTPDQAVLLIHGYRKLNIKDKKFIFPDEIAESSEVRIGLALYHNQFDDPLSLEICKQMILENPQNPIHHMVYSVCAERANFHNEAIVEAETALSILPEERGWMLWAANLTQRYGSIDKAIHYYQMAFDHDPTDHTTGILLAEVLINTKHLEKAEAVLSTISRTASENSYFWYLRAKYDFESHQFIQGLKHIEKAIQIDGDKLTYWILYGELSIEIDNQSIGEKCIRTIYEIDNQDPNGVEFIARFLHKNGKSKDALAILERSIRKPGATLKIRLSHAKILGETNQPDLAIQSLEKLLVDFPDNLQITRLLATINFKNERLDQALLWAEKGLMLNTDQVDLRFLIGKVLRKQGHLDRAIHFLDHVTRQDTTNLDAFMELGNIYQVRREYLRALKTYRKAIDHFPENVELYYQAGLSAREIKDYLGAEELLRKGAKIDPNNINILRQLSAMIALNLVHNREEVVGGL